MDRRRLLVLYPRIWRERYGDEFLATIDADAPLGARQLLDITRGAVDAWTSADVRRATLAGRSLGSAGGSMTLKALTACDRNSMGVTTRDGLIGAGLMLAISVSLRLLAAAALSQHMTAAASLLQSLAFPVAFTASMPFWLMKGTPWKAQAAIVGGTIAILALIWLV